MTTKNPKIWNSAPTETPNGRPSPKPSAPNKRKAPAPGTPAPPPTVLVPLKALNTFSPPDPGPTGPFHYNGLTFTAPFADLLPPLSAEEQEALEKSIQDRGVRVPIVVSDELEVLDGHSRMRYAIKHGIDSVKFDWRSKLSPEQKAAEALSLNLNRRNMTSGQKRQAIAAFLKAYPQLSDRAVGALLHVDGKTVASVRRELGAEIPHPTQRSDKNGRKQAAQKKPRPEAQASRSPRAAPPTAGGQAHAEADRNGLARETAAVGRARAEASVGPAEEDRPMRPPVPDGDWGDLIAYDARLIGPVDLIQTMVQDGPSAFDRAALAAAVEQLAGVAGEMRAWLSRPDTQA